MPQPVRGFRLVGSHLQTGESFNPLKKAMEFVGANRQLLKDWLGCGDVSWPRGDEPGVVLEFSASGRNSMAGPSCGISIVLSLLRLLARVRLQPEVAQTGVFLPSGMICTVGGLEAKIRCARREGFKRCIIPADNYAAMEASGQLKALTDDKFKVVGAKDVVDLLHLTLAGEAVLDLAEGLVLVVLIFCRCVVLTPRRWLGCIV